VYILTRSFLLQTAAIVEAYRLPAGCAIAGALPLSSHYGLGHALILPAVLGARLGLVERFDHRAVLSLFASGDYLYWAGTPVMADMLARAPLPGSHPPSPSICHISAGSLPESVFRAYSNRFGVPLRPSYGRTENGFITVETAPPSEVRSDAVGRTAPGIQIRIGDDPRDPHPAGKIGRVWFSSPWYMQGYGYPTRLAPREGRDGWWPTEDIGTLEHTGHLVLVGRTDDCFKSTSGYLVNPAEIARILTRSPCVGAVAVVPVRGSAGPVIGAIVEATGAVEVGDLRADLARHLPSWLQPEVLLVTDVLPRLPGGKVDRQVCIAILEQARAGNTDQSRAPRGVA
jgi:acyl-CoA synthetase (AMP-forming)/AMP-acid ligase II